MIKLRVYTSKENTQSPILLGIPGLLHENEMGRIDSILEALCIEANITGIRLNFPDIRSEQGGKKIICEINLNKYIRAIRDTIDTIIANDWINHQKIGVIASSIGAGFLGHYLSSFNGEVQPFICALTISPLSGWPAFLTPKVRETILQEGQGINLTTQLDRLNGTTRVIPFEYMGEVMKVDALTALSQSSKKRMDLMTLIGKNDKIVEYDSMKRYHYLLGGNKEGLREYDSEHDIPFEMTRQEILKFFTKLDCTLISGH